MADGVPDLTTREVMLGKFSVKKLRPTYSEPRPQTVVLQVL